MYTFLKIIKSNKRSYSRNISLVEKTQLSEPFNMGLESEVLIFFCFGVKLKKIFCHPIFNHSQAVMQGR